jgi:hypothetical protein
MSMLAALAWMALEAAVLVLAVLAMAMVAKVFDPSAGAAAAAAAEDDGLSQEARAIRRKYLEAKAKQVGGLVWAWVWACARVEVLVCELSLAKPKKMWARGENANIQLYTNT